MSEITRGTVSNASPRQFCRKGMHVCTPAVTLTFDSGARRLHWCEDHAADADAYRADSDGPARG